MEGIGKRCDRLSARPPLIVEHFYSLQCVKLSTDSLLIREVAHVNQIANLIIEEDVQDLNLNFTGLFLNLVVQVRVDFVGNGKETFKF